MFIFKCFILHSGKKYHKTGEIQPLSSSKSNKILFFRDKANTTNKNIIFSLNLSSQQKMMMIYCVYG